MGQAGAWSLQWGEENLRVFRGLCGRKESVTLSISLSGSISAKDDTDGQATHIHSESGILDSKFLSLNDEFGSAQIVW